MGFISFRTNRAYGAEVEGGLGRENHPSPALNPKKTLPFGLPSAWKPGVESSQRSRLRLGSSPGLRDPIAGGETPNCVSHY